MLKNSKYLYGPRDVTVPAHLHFGEFMLDNFWKYKERTALINGATDEIIKYGDLAQEATNLAISLTRLGVRKGDVVAIMSDNRKEYFAIFVGVACTGAVLTTINYMYTEGEMKHIFSISKPTYLFCTSAAYKNQAKALRNMKFKKIIVIDDVKINNTINYKDLAFVNENKSMGTESSLPKDSSVTNNGILKKNVKFEEIDFVSVDGQTDPVVILYSSGTTGLPKGVVLTHHNIITVCNARPIEFCDGVLMMAGPWFHAMGLVGTLTGFSTGKTFAFLPKFELDGMLKTVQKYKVDTLVIVPTVVVAITKSTADFDFSSVRRVMAGAAPLHKDVERDFLQRFPNVSQIIQGYGMTECCLSITRNRFDQGKGQASGTVGKILGTVVVKILDLETEEPLGPYQTGEICMKGDVLMKGYAGKDPRSHLDHEGFFKTGDVGYYDDEGYLFVVDRVKELLKYKGNQVAPAELEAILQLHKAVREAGVVGLHDKEAGDLPLAYVSLQPGMTAREEEIQQFVAEKVSNPKRLRGGVRFLDEIPKSATGKIMRQVLRKMANDPKSKL